MLTHSATLVALLFLVSTAQGQIDTGTTIVHHNGGFGGPEAQITSVANHTAVFLGGRGGWIIHDTFVIGGAGFGLVGPGPLAPFLAAGQRPRLQMGYGGAEIESIIRPHHELHFVLSLLLGGGSARWNPLPLNERSTSFFVAQPGAAVELDIARPFRVDLGLDYREVVGADLHGLPESRLRGLGADVTLKFGRF